MKEIEKAIYIFTTNFNNFINNNLINDAEDIVENVKQLSQFNLDADISIFASLSEQILEQLKALECKEDLLFEKADLIISIFSIKEEIYKF